MRTEKSTLLLLREVYDFKRQPFLNIAYWSGVQVREKFSKVCNSGEITLGSGKKMADGQRTFNANKILQSYKQLVDGIDEILIGTILDHFYASSIFNSEEMHTVQAEKVIEKKNRCFLKFLLEKTKNEDRRNISRIFDEFLNCLRNNGFGSLARLVEEKDSSPVVDPEVGAVLDCAKDLDLDERLLGRVLLFVSSGWEAAAIELGVEMGKITNAKNSGNEYMQKFVTFNAWRRKEGFLPGGLVRLLKALSEFPEIVNWSKMKESLESYRQENSVRSATIPS
ncbi:uncharacterized protein LOC106868330 [Octopus bimaculoides]|uniref:CARD domain-containing protein n=1 Tax=Octopus bimaculoides TaxID=37653 RepID=A0A0L8HVM1_OCTBM|nr:uncharacterized protein LOC106868330 [Octopus bimaculoides]|eukprot:XP_014769018.1 PREDICTED: uncharacterized protein LOC106868330 [Octopus bimaculoides]